MNFPLATLKIIKQDKKKIFKFFFKKVHKKMGFLCHFFIINNALFLVRGVFL